MTKLIGILAVSWLALAIPRARAAESGEVVGWVVQCRGDWEDRTDKAHPASKIDCTAKRNELWHPVTRHAKLERAKARKQESITVRIARTGVEKRFNCDTPGDCEPPPAIDVLAPNPESHGVLAAFLASPARAYTQIRLMLSRSSNPAAERVTVDHAVVTEGAPITLKELIRPQTPAGEYLLELCPFDAENGCPKIHKPIAAKWDPAAASTSTAWPELLKPGLYQVVMSTVVNGTSMRTSDRGLLLVTRRDADQSIREQVKAGEELFLKEWKDRNEGDVMFKALLVHLAKGN